MNETAREQVEKLCVEIAELTVKIKNQCKVRNTDNSRVIDDFASEIRYKAAQSIGILRQSELFK